MSVFDLKSKNLIFKEARTHNDWLDKDISNDILMEIFDLMKWGPTSANCSPARIIFVKSKVSKDRLLPFVIESNLEKTKSAPVTAIIGHDINFHDHLPKLFPHNLDAQNWFNHSIDIAEETAFRNGSMQGAYFIIAARALGLDCGPMSGFDKEGVDNEFFRDTNIKSNFLCNLGYGDKTKLFENYAYTRVYKVKDELRRHKDRFSCEISTTLNLGGDKPWPIYINPKQEEGTWNNTTEKYIPSTSKGIKVDLKPGDMLLYRGNILEHWREPFIGNHCAQVFLHYNDVKTPGAEENALDRRPHLGLPNRIRRAEKKIP